MRRLRRILLNAATAASLLILVTTLVLWPLTTRRRDALRHVVNGGAGFEIATAPHGVDFTIRDHFQLAAPPLTLIPPGWSTESYAWGPPQTGRIPSSPPPYAGTIEYVEVPIGPDHGYEPPAHRFLGFGWEAPGSGYLVRTWRVVIPLWFAAAAFALLPLARCRSAVTRLRRARAALCPACGYDIRAIPDRCPECGSPAATAAAPVAVTSPPSTTTRLDYSHDGRRSRRRWYLGAGVVLLLVLTLAVAGRRYYPAVSRHFALRDCVDDCVNWNPPAGTAVYDEDPAAVRTLGARRGTYVRRFGAELRVPPMERLASLVPLGALRLDFEPPILTQTLRLPGGDRRIVGLYIASKGSSRDEASLSFDGVVVAPGRWYEAPRLSRRATGPVEPTIPEGAVSADPAAPDSRFTTIHLTFPRRGGFLRIEAGAPDPADPASALYPYSFGGQRGRIRVRLLPDERIELSAESGPLANQHGRETPAPP